MYYNYQYSLFSVFERRYNRLNQNDNIDVIKYTKQQSERLNSLEEMRMLEKRIYNEFNQIEFLNYIPFDIFKTVVKDLYFIYIKEFQYGNAESFIDNKFGTIIYECGVILEHLEKGKINWWDSIEDFDFYNYQPSIYDFKVVCWSSISEDDPHFFSQYLKNILEYLEVGFSKEIEQTETESEMKETKTNKSLLYEGSPLNLSERYKIANEVLNIDKKIRTLNIQDLEKYQLLAYILGCDKDNARNLMNGTYRSKDRDLSKYFDDLGLNR